MKRNSKQTKGWGFKFMAILSSIIMVINTVTPVVPVFAETPNEVIPAEDPTPAGDPAEDTVPADNDADKPATEATPAEKPAEDADTANNADKPATVETPKTDEDADKSADSQTITEQTDGNQDSGAKNNTSNGSDEKENNNTDQSLQNGENSETVETPKADADKPAENVNLEYVVNAKSTKGISLTNASTIASIGGTEYPTLMDAVNAAKVGDTISLTADITVNNFTVSSDKDFTLDLNGYTLTLENTTPATGYPKNYDYIYGSLTINDTVGNGKVNVDDYGLAIYGKLKVQTGTFVQTYDETVFYLMGGELEILNGSFSSTYNIVNCYSAYGSPLGGIVTIKDGNFKIEEGEYSDTAIIGWENSDITIEGGEFSGLGTHSVYIGASNALTSGKEASEDGKLTIKGGIFEKAVEVGDGNNSVISGGTFEGYVGADGANLTINGGSFTTTSEIGSYGEATVTIKLGTFNGTFDEYSDGTIEIKGGTFALNPREYLAEGKKVVYDKDWKYEVVNGENEYENLSLVEVSPDTNTIVGDQNTELTLEVTQNDPSVITGISSEIGTDSGNIAGVVKLTFKDAQNNNLQESVKFNKAVLVKVPVTGTDPVKIRIKHGNENFGIRGLATDPTDCSEGEASDNSKKYDGSAVTPEGGFVNIYICEASEIAAVRLSSSVAELNNTEYGTLEAAVAQAQDGDIVTLLTGITLTDTLILDGKDIKLDLGGNTLTGASGKKAIFLKKGNLEISNGTIYTDDQAVNVCTANADVSNYANLKVDKNARIIGAYAIILREAGYNINETINCGGSGKEGYGATLSISGTLEGNLWIMGNIESGDSKVDISGTIRSENSAGVAQQGYVTVNVHTGAYIYSEGRTAFEQRAGITNIYGGTLKSDATSYVVAPNNNGTTTTGAAFAVSPYNLAIQKVNIYSGTFIAEKALVITNTISGGLNKVNSVNVEGGIYSGEVVSENTIETNKIENFISGGTFSSKVKEEYCAAGLIPTDADNEGKFTVKSGEYVAQIGTTKYETLSGAIAVVPTDGTETTIKLLKDTAEELMVITDKNIILDLNNKTLTGGFDLYKGNLTIDSGTLIGIAHINGSSNDSLAAGNYNKLIIGSGAIIKGGEYAVILWQVDSNKGYGSQIDIYGKLERSFWVMGNITNGNSIINMYGTIDSPDVGIAENGHVTLNIYEGAKITAGDDAVEQRAGILNIFGGKLESAATSYSCESNPSGTAGGGAALIIAQHTTKLQLVTNIEGGVFSGLNGLGICNPQNNTAPTPSISIESGNFIGSNYGVMLNDDVYTNKVQNFISGGTFSSPVNPDYCAYGFIPKGNEDGTYGVISGYKVTFINEGSEYTGLYIETNGTIAENLVIDPSKTGYTFTGWYDAETGGTKRVFGNEGTKVTASGTLYARYDANTYKVHFNGGDATAGSMDDQSFTYDNTNATLTPNGFTRNGYSFSGWNTKADGDGDWYVDSASVLNLTSVNDGTVTLYAQWTEVARTVNSQAELVAALAVPTIETITIGSSFDVESSVIIDRAVTIDGSGNTISMSGNQEWVSGGHNYIFKVYPASSADITIKDLKLTHALGAMIVGPNASVEVDNVDVSGNIWGGVEVKNVDTASLSGNLIINDEKYEKPVAWVHSVVQLSTVNLLGATSGTIASKPNQIQYYLNPVNLQFYTITFDTNSGSAVEAMTGIYDATITLPYSTRDGYTFSGWKAEDGTKYNSGASYTISGNATLTGVWDTVKYNITYHLDGGIEPTPANVTGYTIEGSVTLTAPTKIGYTFLGWTGVNQSLFSGEAITIGTTGDKEFTANWQINEYRVNYHTGGHGALIESYTGVNYGALIPQTPLANVEGWTFSGWTLSGGGVIPATMPAHDIDLVAEWTIKSHNLTYSYVGTVPAGAPTGYTGTESVEYGSGITLKGTPAMSGYTFSGWILSGATATSNSFTMPDNDIEILGEWIVQQFTITFDTNGGTDVAPITQDYNTSVTAPTPATKTGYQFSGWNPAVPATMPAENMIITGEWTANIYTVNFNSGGATSGTMNPQVFTYADATTSYPLTANVFEKEGYTFSGWTDGANKYADGADVIELIKANSGTLDLTAEWKVNSHLLKYVVDGTEVYTGMLNYGDPITQYQDPTKDCNGFAGWTSNVEGITTGSKMPDSDVTFTANWNYTCSRSSGGGGGGGSSRNNTNNMQEVVLGGEVEVNTGDKAEINTGDENNDEGKGSIGDTQGYDPELVEAYKWAYAKGITTMPTIEKARLKDGITRAELAKMMVVFMSEVLHRQPVITETFDYPDVNEKALGDLTGYIQLAYQYQIMGIQADGKPLNKFNPRGKVSRAEFATVLSRVLYGSVNNQKGSNYREKHIEALNKAGILTNTDPKIQELRGWIILMLYRSQNSETNNVEENTAQVTTGDVAEVESGSAAEVATGTTAEIDTGAVVEAATGATAETAITEANTGDVAKVESGSTAEVATGDSK